MSLTPTLIVLSLWRDRTGTCISSFVKLIYEIETRQKRVLTLLRKKIFIRDA